MNLNTLSRTVFVAYMVMLLWLVLFKLSYHPLAVIQEVQTRHLNLVPFASSKGEMISNIVAFIPFGVMLGVIFKRAAPKYLIAAVCVFSFAIEIVQYALAIGVTDVTDLIMNTLGGLIGLGAYAAMRKVSDERSLDLFITAAGALILLSVLYLRVFVFIVRY